MLDMKWIKQNQEEIQSIAEQKGIQITIAELIRWDETKRRLMQEVEQLRRERNRWSQAVGHWVQHNETIEAAEKAKLKVKDINDRLKTLEKELDNASTRFEELMLLVPNRVSAETPAGKSDQDNVVLKLVGEPSLFGFEAKDHVTLGELHGIIDIPRGVKSAGSRNYYLRGAGFLLHRAVQQLAIDLLMRKGFALLEVPLMVRGEPMKYAGFFPLGEDQTYRIEGMNQWLIGTSEVPLVSYYSNEIVSLAQPIRLAAVSHCFRNEVGSAGKDTHGLYRVHQFAKVEQVVLCVADMGVAERLLQEITGNAEELLTLLELPYRVMSVCIGDMSQKTYKQFDIECWMPSRNAYGETHSSSSLLDFQARRANIRYRDAEGKLRYCYTLNNTAVASPRILIPLLENHQQEDGSIRIPPALRPYMNGLEKLLPPVR